MTVYNATRYTSNIPEGMDPITVLYGGWYNETLTERYDDLPNTDPYDWNWARYSNKLHDTIDHGALVCGDIENMPANVTDRQQFNDTVGKMRLLLKFAKEMRPDITLGQFGCPPYPMPRYRSQAWNHRQHQEVVLWDNLIRPMGDHCDVIFPDLYCYFVDDYFEDGESLLRRYMSSTMGSALATGKRVIPFISASYPNGVMDENRAAVAAEGYLSESMLATYLSYIDELCGDVVIWDYKANNGPWPDWLQF